MYSSNNLENVNEACDETLHALNEVEINMCNSVSVHAGSFHPTADCQFIRLDALDPHDWPNAIGQNSVYITFKVVGPSVEVLGMGHIWLSDEDKNSDKYKYLAMKTMERCHTDYGNKKFRKTRWKDRKDLANKIAKYWNEVMESVNKYTGGYPYKHGKND